LKLLRPSGRLVFSTNYTRFKLDTESLADLAVDDLSAATIPKDFERHARIHRCYSVRFK
jgi:23S rRNA (guanine2445-N2)-methyltransferase / 23S rRNA (guanine2069-N7)-methyltransferase